MKSPQNQSSFGVVEGRNRVDDANPQTLQSHLADTGSVWRLHGNLQTQTALGQKGFEPATRCVFRVQRQKGNLCQLFRSYGFESCQRMGL